MRIVRSILLMVLLTTMPFAGCLEPVEDLEAPGPIESTTYVNMTVSYMTREGGTARERCSSNSIQSMRPWPRIPSSSTSRQGRTSGSPSTASSTGS